MKTEMVQIPSVAEHLLYTMYQWKNIISAALNSIYVARTMMREIINMANHSKLLGAKESPANELPLSERLGGEAEVVFDNEMPKLAQSAPREQSL